MDELSTTNIIEDRIFTIRGQKVMIDRDLADLYGVETKKLNQAVKRNIERFPMDFMFQLTDDEQRELVTNCDHLKNLRYSYQNAYVFTEQGIAMLSSVLQSKQAIAVNIQIMRTFVKIKQFALTQASKNQELAELRKMLMLHIENSDNKFTEHDKAISQIINVLNHLIEQPRETKKIGFRTE